MVVDEERHKKDKYVKGNNYEEKQLTGRARVSGWGDRLVMQG